MVLTLKTGFLISWIVVQACVLAGDPELLSVKEASFRSDKSNEPGQTCIVFEWRLPSGNPKQESRTFYVNAGLYPDRHDCEVRFSTMPETELAKEKVEWVEAPRLSRDEFVRILVLSEKELRQRKGDWRFKSVRVQYQLINEHAAELSPQIKRVIEAGSDATEEAVHEAVRELRGVFSSSKAIAVTRNQMKSGGLDFVLAGLDPSFHFVFRKPDGRWKAASGLPGFGLLLPPMIEFQRQRPEKTVDPKLQQ